MFKTDLYSYSEAFIAQTCFKAIDIKIEGIQCMKLSDLSNEINPKKGCKVVVWKYGNVSDKI